MWKRSWIAFVLGCTLSLSTFPAYAISLSFSPPAVSVVQGDAVTVAVVIAGLGDFAAPSLSTFDIIINFDPAILSFSTVVFGAFLGTPDTDPDPLVSNSSETEMAVALNPSTPDVLNLFALSLLEGDSVTCVFCLPPFLEDLQPSNFTLATLTFNTLATTATPSLLTMSVTQLGDANGDPLALTADLGTSAITVLPQQPGEVPEPGTIILLGTGLIVLLCRAWRKKCQTRSVPGPCE